MSQVQHSKRNTWLILAAVFGWLLAAVLVWQWHTGGIGLIVTALAAVGLGVALSRWWGTVLSRAPQITAKAAPPFTAAMAEPDTQPASTLPDTRAPSQKWLHLSQTLVNKASHSSSLAQALQDVGQQLHDNLGSRNWTCLRVEGWNGESALLRPWVDPGDISDDHIDPGAMSTVHRDDPSLGQALALRQPCLAEYPPLQRAAPPPPWRVNGARNILAIPVVVDNWPVALLEYIDPLPLTSDLQSVLQIAMAQLSFVAQRDNTQARIANDAEHLGRLGLVASRISSGVAVLDHQGHIEWINPMFVALTGLSHQKVLGRTLPELLAQEVNDGYQAEHVRQLLAGGGPFRISYEATRQSGATLTRYWGEIDAILMLDESGGRGQYVCLFNDITTRKQQEHQQAQEKEFLEALLGNLPISLLVLDPTDLSVAAINRYAEFELGLKHDEVVKRRLADVLGQDVLDVVEPQMRKAINTGEAMDHDFVWRNKERRFVVNARHFALRHTNGQPRLLITLARDVTAQRQASLDLAESERRFRELVESMDDCVYVATQGHESFVYHSPQLPQVLGVSAQALRTQANLFDSLVIAQDQSVLQRAAQGDNGSSTGASTDIVVRIEHPSQGLRWLRRRSRIRQLDDGAWRIYGLISDVTDERQQALELQRARDAAESASQAKSQFMASMSHEIRTPMNAILGMTELLLGTPLSDKQRRYGQAVFRSGESLLEIINDILDFSKIEAGRLELAPTDFSPQTLLDDALELMAPRAHEKGLELTAHFQPGLPPIVHADSMRLQQIITNLVANAIKFTEHGEVVVGVRRIDTDLGRTAADMVGQRIEMEFSVRDTGIGISEDVIPKLFSAFTQAHAGLARRYGGTGLGLAITKQLVELMGGRIDIHSSLGVGSEFTFSIPVTVAEGSADLALVDDLDIPALHILAVDDNATNLTVIENMLTAWGMRVTCAHDGQEALDFLLASPTQDRDIDMALVDMNMPRVDGLVFAQKLKQSGRYKQLKLVLLSSMSTTDDVHRSQEVGYDRFVPKPLRKTELRQAILGLSADLMQPLADLAPLHLHVLVIEDNPVNQEVCSQMLTRLGCRAQLASSAMEGLRKLCDAHYDIILMDIHMPGMDGEETLHQFRSAAPSRFKFLTPPSTPVIAVTANSDEQRFIQLGFNAYLPKPFRLQQLARVLQSCAAGRKPTALAQRQSDSLENNHAANEAHMSAAGKTLPPAAVFVAPANWQDVFDEQAVQRLIELDPSGKNHLIERVTKMFSSSVDKYIAQLEDAWRAGDLKNVRDVVHTLKSSSANLGALKLSQCCVEIEALIRDQTGDDLSPLIIDLRDKAALVQVSLPLLLEVSR